MSYDITGIQRGHTVDYNYVAKPVEQAADSPTVEQLEKRLNARVQPYWYAPNESTIMATIICNGCSTEHKAIYPVDYIRHAKRCCNEKPQEHLDPSNLANLFSMTNSKR